MARKEYKKMKSWCDNTEDDDGKLPPLPEQWLTDKKIDLESSDSIEPRNGERKDVEEPFEKKKAINPKKYVIPQRQNT